MFHCIALNVSWRGRLRERHQSAHFPYVSIVSWFASFLVIVLFVHDRQMYILSSACTINLPLTHFSVAHATGTISTSFFICWLECSTNMQICDESDYMNIFSVHFLFALWWVRHWVNVAWWNTSSEMFMKYFLGCLITMLIVHGCTWLLRAHWVRTCSFP